MTLTKLGLGSKQLRETPNNRVSSDDFFFELHLVISDQTIDMNKCFLITLDGTDKIKILRSLKTL